MNLKSIQHRAYIALILFFAFMPVSYGVIRTIVLSSSQVSGILPVSKGGTGSATAGDARTALGLATYSNTDSSWTNGEQLTVTHGSFSDVIVTGYKTVATVPTIIMMHGNGSDGSSTLTEQNGKTVTNSGTVLATGQKVFGSASIHLPSAGNYFTVARTGWEFNDGSWTLEMRFRPTDLSGMAGGRTLMMDIQGGTTIASILTIEGTTLKLYLSSNGSSWDIANSVSCGTVTVDTWHHVALVWDGSHYDAYLNGTRNAHVSSASALYNTAMPLTFGRHSSENSAQYVGYYDEIALHGSAIYSGASITVPTAEYSDGTVKTGLRNGTDYTYTFDSNGTYITNASGSTLNTVRFDVFPIN